MQLRRLLRPPLVALLAVQISVCASAGPGENPVNEGKREKSAGGRQPEKRGTLRLTAIPGHNTFPYRYVYPLGQPAFAQYASYTTPRTAHPAALASPSAGLKLAGYPVPSTAMLLVMAHPHAGSPYAGTFMLIPAASAYNYNALLPQVAAPPVAAAPVPGRVAYAYAIPATPAAHYIKPGYANIVAAHQLLYKGPSSAQGGTSAYSGEDETESAESSTVSTYGSRTRGAAPAAPPPQHFKGR
ncbi:hypothetical protein LSTR_LSTR003104 [Laodelphax striatellus]|uniref:Uncharacterized protein n=1 Tax=Laodelphax striatellus TaxID=195883 RepID=A0A482WW12_LAOST|nr:hypothetical protein LSTR_LSTR003104 [Laodelphax striatellus]